MIDFANRGEAIEMPADLQSFLSEEEREAFAKLSAEARMRIEADQRDSSQQQFFMRLDTKTVVKDEKEYERCQKLKVGLKVIPYGHAIHLLKEEEARKRQRIKNKRKKKVARKARKVNRR